MHWQDLYKYAINHLDTQIIVQRIERLFSTDRYFTFNKFSETAAYVIEEMKRIGLSDVYLHTFPADGTYDAAGFIMPKAWNIEAASLDIVSPVQQPVCSYADCPQHLVMYSAPTEGPQRLQVLNGESTHLPLERLSNAMLFTGQSISAVEELLMAHNAYGIITDFLDPLPGIRSREDFPEAVRWQNACFKPDNKYALRGFNLSKTQGDAFRRLLNDSHNVEVTVNIQGQLYNGSIHAMTGIIPGICQEEILVVGHLFEPGANDNCSGGSLILALAELLRNGQQTGEFPVFKKTIRILLTWEFYGLLCYFQSLGEKRQNLIGGINIDDIAGSFEHTHAPMMFVDGTHAQATCFQEIMETIVEYSEQQRPLKKIQWTSYFPDDNLGCDPQIDIPTYLVCQFQSRFWHTNKDTTDALDLEQAVTIGGIALAFIGILAHPETDFFNTIIALLQQQYDRRSLFSHDEREYYRVQYILKLQSLKKFGPAELSEKIDAIRNCLGNDVFDFTELHHEETGQTPNRTRWFVPNALRILERLPLEKRIQYKDLITRLEPHQLEPPVFWCNGSRDLTHIHRLWELERGTEIPYEDFYSYMELCRELDIIAF